MLGTASWEPQEVEFVIDVDPRELSMSHSLTLGLETIISIQLRHPSIQSMYHNSFSNRLFR